MKPQDIVILAKILLMRDAPWTYQKISAELSISQSECHAAIKRSFDSGLFNGLKRKVSLAAFREFIIYGLKYIYPAQVGQVTRGVPTLQAVGSLKKEIIPVENEIYVWPYAEGGAKGQSVIPLYRSVPETSLVDEEFYMFMVIIDFIRMGQARERSLALKQLDKIMKGNL